MSIASQPSPPTAAPRRPIAERAVDAYLKAWNVVFHFLASLKLAVFSLASLAAVLAYATFFEKDYGTAAVQEWIYRSKWFAVLLLFLGMNILCAALIRYPWKKRQTGFVITHAGLLTVLAGALVTFQLADEGQVSLLEGEKTDRLVRIDHPTLRVRPLDAETGAPSSEYSVPFKPTNFDWKPGKDRPQAGVVELWNGIMKAFSGSQTPKGETLTRPRDPFQITLKGHYPASMPRFVHEERPGGDPMIKASLLIKAPGAVAARDVLEDPADSWVTADDRAFRRSVQAAGPLVFAFQYASTPEMVRDFLELPAIGAGKVSVARVRYVDRSGNARVFDWTFGPQAPKPPFVLPESDLTVTSAEERKIPAKLTLEGNTIDLRSRVGGETADLVVFKVKRGAGAEVNQFAFSMLPVATEVLEREGLADAKGRLVKLSYFHPPILDANRRRGFIEVMGDHAGKLYYRGFTITGLKGPGPLAPGEKVRVLGDDKSPMSGHLAVARYIPEGKEELIYEPVKLAQNQMGNGIPAAFVAMTVGDETQEFWVRRGGDLDPHFNVKRFKAGDFEIAYDFDRLNLGFDVELVKFEVGFDPGTEQAKSYLSDVLVDDPAKGLRKHPVRISMNLPMVHRNWTFYQSSYLPERDPETNRKTGAFRSIFQVGYDPGRALKYLGCGLVVFGAFVQFYMRAGIFTDGGKREREREADKLAKRKINQNGKS